MIRWAVDLAERMTPSDVKALSDNLLDPTAEAGTVVRRIPHPQLRSHVRKLLSGFSDRETVAAALMAASEARQRIRPTGSEIVWTGPGTDAPFRRTEPALLELIASTVCRLTIVSYAVHRIPRVRSAVADAAGRGVRIRIVLETPHLRSSPNAEPTGFDTVRAFGLDSDDERIELLHWPEDCRPPDAGGRRGILHVKCVLADGQRMFVSSANLTEYAFTTNMELGLLVDDPQRIRHVETHFDGLIDAGVLQPVPAV